MANTKAKVTTNLVIRIHNLETGEIIDREMTDDENTKFQNDIDDWFASQPVEPKTEL